MSMDVQKSQLVSDLPLSVSGQRGDKVASLAIEKPVSRAETDSKLVATTETADRSQDTDTGKLVQAVDKVNQQLKSNELKFEVVQELGMTVVKVIDTTEDKIIRQIPSEEAIKRLEDIQKFLDQSVYQQDTAKLKDSITGLIFNQTL